MEILSVYSGVELGAAFASWLAQRLDERGLGNNQFAEYVGVGKNTVSAWRRGVSDPSPVSCRKIADYFKRPTDEVLALVGHRPTRGAEERIISIEAQVAAIQRRDEERTQLLERMAKEAAESRVLLAELVAELRRLGRESDEPDGTPRLLAQADGRPRRKPQPRR